MANTNITKYVMKELRKGVEINGEIVDMVYSDFQNISNHKLKLYERYTVKDIPINHRNFTDELKVDNRLNNDFVGEIIDTKIGYMLGTPIKYAIDKNTYENTDLHRQHQGVVNDFIIRNTMNDLDIELGKFVSICGVGGREIYIDSEGNEKVANLKPWETVFLTGESGVVEYAFRFYSESRMVENELKEVRVCEFFNSESVTYFINYKDKFEFDEELELNPLPHLFGMCPIVKVVNNNEEMGDTERVNELIDAYDRTTSDVNSEIEQFRLAYMYFKGEEPTREMIESARKTGGFYVGTDGEVGFITKNMNDVAVENHLDRLEKNISRFAKHVNMSDPEFGGGDSSLANKYNLSALEMKSKMLEVKMSSALLRQFKIITNIWAKKGININYLNIFTTFTRNLPANILDEAQITNQLRGAVSERTRLAQLSFVDDVDYEIEQMEEDNKRTLKTLDDEESVEERVNLDNLEEE